MGRTKTLGILTLIFALCCSLFIGTLAIKPTQAKADDVNYKKKIVSVLFDNSGSMTIGGREHYARYAAQMLMSFLGPDDELIFTDMNTGSAVQSFEVNLKASNRDAEIKRVMSSTFLGEEFDTLTPGRNIGYALDKLIAKGLKDKNNLLQSDGNIEHWLFIMTDGEFDSYNGHAEAGLIEYFIKDYPSLRSVYLGFGSGAKDLSGKGLENKYMFTPYKTADASALIRTMQEVANRISGRYEIPSSKYVINGNKVTVDLNTIDFSLNNVTVIAQNFGGTLLNAKYNGSPISIERPCVFVPASNLGMKNGYSAILKGNPYLYGGTIELEFSAPVTEISILAEPALSITPVIKYNDNGTWKETNMQFINSTLKGGDQILIDYRVYEMANGEEIDLSNVFGDTETKVTYAGNSFECGVPFDLVNGINEIGVSVSVMNGAYTLSDSFTCVIEANPNYYRVTADYNVKIDINSPKITTTYTVYSNNVPVTKQELSKYTYEVKLFGPDGNEIQVTKTVDSDGKIIVSTNLPMQSFGEYREEFKVTNEHGLSRTCDPIVRVYLPDKIDVKVVEGKSLSMTVHQFESNNKPVLFQLSADGKPISFDSPILRYTLKCANVDVTNMATATGNTLTYTPKASDIGYQATSIGDKTISLVVTDLDGVTLAETSEAVVTLTNTVFHIEAVSGTNLKIDRFNLEGSKASMYFRVTRDGELIDNQELSTLLADGTISVVDDGTFGGQFWLPCGTEVSVKDVGGESLVVVDVIRDMSIIDTFMSMLIFNGDRQIKISLNGVTATENFTFDSSPIFEYIWRILVILFIIYLVLYVIGFFKSKMFPSGTFVTITLRDGKDIIAYVEPVNIALSQKVMWHIKRFFIVWKLTWIKQKEKEFCDSAFLVKFDKGSTAPTVILQDKLAAVRYSKQKSKEYAEYVQFLESFKSSSYQGEDPDVPTISSNFLRDIYKVVPNGIKAEGSTVGLTEQHYAIFNREGKISYIVFFSRKNRKS